MKTRLLSLWELIHTGFWFLPSGIALVGAAFTQIRQNATTNVAASIRLLEVLQAVAVVTSGSEQREIIRRHAEMIHRAVQKALVEQSDRDDLEERFHEVMEKLAKAPHESAAKRS